MSTTPIPQLQAITTAAVAAAGSASSAFTSANSIAPLVDQVQGIIDGAAQTIQGLKDTNQTLTNQNQTFAAQLTTERARKPVTYFSLEKNQLFAADKKIPFQWIQPGNTGNTGGGSPLPHGTETWVTGPGGTIITSVPQNIAPRSDNFDNYMVLPYPTLPPRRMRTWVKNYSARTPADWAKSQQMEGPVIEYKGGGAQYTCAWSFNPKTGLHYWGGATGTWIQFLDSTGSPIMINLDGPTYIEHETSLDQNAKTFTYQWVLINGRLILANKKVNAVAIPTSVQEHTIAVQLDCQPAAPSYQAVLDGLNTEWE